MGSGRTKPSQAFFIGSSAKPSLPSRMVQPAASNWRLRNRRRQVLGQPCGPAFFRQGADSGRAVNGLAPRRLPAEIESKRKHDALKRRKIARLAPRVQIRLSQ